MINIAYVIDTIEAPSAGTEKQLLMLVENLAKYRFSPHLVFLRDSTWIKTSTLPCPVCILNLPSFKSFRLIAAFKIFKKYCERNDIGIVQTFFRDANIFGTIAAYFSGVKIIISSRRNFGLGYWHNRYWLIILRALRYITSCYVSNSRTTADYTAMSEHVSRDKLHVIHNGLCLESFKEITSEDRESYRSSLGIKPNEILVGCTSNLRPIKNLPHFIRVAASIHNKYPHTRFIIVGDGHEEAMLRKMISEYSLENVFALAGQQDDVLPFILSMDIGVLCSKSESLSNSIIEYMAAGLPCVVSQIGGNLEAIGYEYGFSFRSDDEEDFFAKLERLIVNKRLRLNIGRRAKSYAFFNYDQGYMVKSYEELYRRYYDMLRDD